MFMLRRKSTNDRRRFVLGSFLRGCQSWSRCSAQAACAARAKREVEGGRRNGAEMNFSGRLIRKIALTTDP